MTPRYDLLEVCLMAAVVAVAMASSSAHAQDGACCVAFIGNSALCSLTSPGCVGTFGGVGSTCGDTVYGGIDADDAVAQCVADIIPPPSLPVEFASFEAIADGQRAVLGWTTASETNNAGFAVEQEVGTEVFAEIGFVEGNGTTSEMKEYHFEVSDLDPGLHRFRLRQIDFDGAFEYSAVVEAVIAVPDQFLIEAAYPNPFNPSTTLRFAVASEQQVAVTLVNAAGQTIRTLFRGTVAPNEMKQLSIDASGLPSGTYLVHFEGGGLSASERIVLAK